MLTCYFDFFFTLLGLLTMKPCTQLRLSQLEHCWQLLLVYKVCCGAGQHLQKAMAIGLQSPCKMTVVGLGWQKQVRISAEDTRPLVSAPISFTSFVLPRPRCHGGWRWAISALYRKMPSLLCSWNTDYWVSHPKGRLWHQGGGCWGESRLIVDIAQSRMDGSGIRYFKW